MLQNAVGSTEYQWFLSELGSLIRLKDCHMTGWFVGGLDTVWGNDGEFALCWRNEVCHIVFHAATLMPGGGPVDGSAADSEAVKRATINRKRHIGNDNVVIVYLEEDGAYEVMAFLFLTSVMCTRYVWSSSMLWTS